MKSVINSFTNQHLCVARTVPAYEDEYILKLKNHVALLFDELREPVYRYVLCLSMHPAQAEEITQETFLRLYGHLYAGGKGDNLRCWVFRVAHNLSINELKRQKYTIESSPELWAEVSRSTADPSPTPEEILLRKERMVRVHAAFSMLSGQQKECLLLRAEGLRYREIAEILGVTISTVTESLRRAISKLIARSYA